MISNYIPKNELIQKLEKIRELYRAASGAEEEMRNYVPEDNYKREVVMPDFPSKNKNIREALDDPYIHNDDNALKRMEKEYDRKFCPRKPKQPYKSFKSPGKPSLDNSPMGIFLDIVSGFALLVSALVALFGKGDIGNTITAAVSSLYLTYRYGVRLVIREIDYKNTYKQAKKEYEKAVQKDDGKYQESLKNYERKYAEYLEERPKFLEEYAKWLEIYRVAEEARAKEEKAIESKLKKSKEEAREKIYRNKYIPAQRKLEEYNDLVPEEYLKDIILIIRDITEDKAFTLEEAFALRDKENREFRESQAELRRQYKESTKEKTPPPKEQDRCAFCIHFGRCHMETSSAGRDKIYGCPAFRPQ